MQSKNYDEQTVTQVTERVPEAKSVIRSYHIATSRRVPLDVAAAEASVTPDELRAVMEYKARLAAHQAPAVREYGHPAEIVA